MLEINIEKNKAQKKFSEGNYDWSSQLIINSFKTRFFRLPSPSVEFSKFTLLILGGQEKELELNSLERNNNVGTLIKCTRQLQIRIEQVS